MNIPNEKCMDTKKHIIPESFEEQVACSSSMRPRGMTDGIRQTGEPDTQLN